MGRKEQLIKYRHSYIKRIKILEVFLKSKIRNNDGGIARLKFRIISRRKQLSLIENELRSNYEL